MPDKHSDTDEVEAILEAYRKQYINADLGTFNDNVQAIEADNAKHRARAAIQSILTSEKRKLLLKLSKQNYLGAVPMDAIDAELASLEQLGEL